MSDSEDAPLPFEAVNATPGTRNIRLTLAYDGTDYNGWQVQPDRPSVQACVEHAIQKITGEQRRVYCAGRTDAGVHALGQEANFFTLSRIPAASFRPALQTELPDDIVLIRSQEVPMGFHATFTAIRKRYRYVIHDGAVCPPFLRRYCAHSRFVLDAERMHQAAACLLGTHDFRCFEKEYPNKLTSVRTIMDARVYRSHCWPIWQGSHSWGQQPTITPSAETDTPPFIVFEVMANGFLYNMVRAIVGTLTDIGRGRQPVDYLQTVIQSLDRAAAGMTAVPQGLYLVNVEYPASESAP
jgi:tRNA pseudouridine38-40 synthase